MIETIGERIMEKGYCLRFVFVMINMRSIIGMRGV